MMLRIRTAALPALLALSFGASAAVPDTEAVEFYNAITNHYFVTATSSEAQVLDSGGAGPGWLRTGRSFPAWLDKSAAAADAQPVCRFYSSGANSHFYTAGADECAALREIENSQRARGGNFVGWQFEGTAFFVQAPTGGQCPAGTVAIKRAYNNGFVTGEGSNHRFLDDNELQQVMQDQSWIAEGTVMCSQPKAVTGTNANLAVTTTRFDTLVATWTGNARWKSESNGNETRTTAPLTLTVAADGAITGSGNGCTFTGSVQSGDGFRSLFKASVTAAGCTVASFNGDYQFTHLQRFGTGSLMVNMKREAGPVEAKIEALLTTDSASTPPPTTPSASGFGSVAGDWVGTVGWIAKQEGKDDDGDRGRNAVNRPLSLTITTAGALSGSGFGCTFSGTLATKKSGEAGFGGTVAATGCENAVFNGTFNDVRVRREDGGRIEVDFKRQASGSGPKTQVEIEGTLQAAGNTTPPPPPVPADPLVTGAWEGNVTWMATARSTGGSVRTVVVERHALQLTIGDNGATTGSGFGCTFTGQLTLNANKREVTGGTLTATGCTNALFNGTYDKIEMEREDGRALEVEIRRENEVNGTKTEVRIEGTLARA